MDGSESTGSRGITDILAHISEKPWSDYVAADYTVEQWHAACLIHQHNGAPTSKGQCKLPVRTPSGIVNRNGVYSAAAAMGGARGGVDASEDEKATAAHALIRLYKELDKEPPPALLSHSVDNILAHFGTTGMKWGVRKSRTGDIKPRATLSRSDRRGVALTREAKLSDPFYSEVYQRSSSRIRKGTRQLNSNPKFMGKDFRVDSTTRRSYYDAYSKMVTNQLNATVGSRSMNPFRRLGMPTKRLELHFDYNVRKELSPRVTIRPTDTRTARKSSEIKKKEIRESIKHASDVAVKDFDEIEVFLITDEKGYILNLDVPGEDDDALKQTDYSIDNILSHFGTLGMRWGRRKGRSETDVASESHNPDSQTSVSLYGKPGKGIVSTKGGAKRLPSSDAEKAAVYHQILRKSGTDSLSNEQLKIVVDRMGLEERYSKAQGKTVQKSGGRLFAEKVLKNEADSLAKGRPGPLALGAMAVLGYGLKRKMGDKDGGGEKKKEKGAKAAKGLLDSVGSSKLKDKSNKPFTGFNKPKSKTKPYSNSSFDLNDFMPPKVMQTAISSTPFKLPSGPSGPGFNPTGFGKPASWK